MKNYSNQVQLHERVMENGDHFKNGASPKSLMSRKKFKLFALFAFILLFGVKAMAQDVIVLKSGDEIKSLVQEVGTEYVKYKKFDNQSGPVYNVAISQIFMIKYENGSYDVINEPAKQQKTKQEESVIPNQVEQFAKPAGERQEVQKQEESAILSVGRGNKIYLDGRAIKYEQVVNILASNDMLTNVGANDMYKSGLSQIQTAQTLNKFGWSFFSTGVLFSVLELMQQKESNYAVRGGNSYYSTVGYVCLGVSLVCFNIKYFLKNSGQKRVTDAINIYNNSIQSKHHLSDLSLNFGVTRSGGVGFTLDF